MILVSHTGNIKHCTSVFRNRLQKWTSSLVRKYSLFQAFLTTCDACLNLRSFETSKPNIKNTQYQLTILPDTNFVRNVEILLTFFR